MLIYIAIPLGIFIILSMYGNSLGQIGATYFILLFFGIAIIFNFITLASILQYNESYYVNLGIWFKFDSLCVEWEFLFDMLSITMLTIVLIISFCVHLYSIAYIWQDAHYIRFISLLSLFTFFILVLITAGNLLQFFIGWEGIGLCSYLLINFWHTRLQANKAALKAILVNKIGDLFFLVAIGLAITQYATLDFAMINSLSLLLYEGELVIANVAKLSNSSFSSINLLFLNDVDTLALMLFIAVCAKSAQFGLHTWLPSAIEGPTPVSALIHAATIVTAGIFLVLRLAVLFSLSIFVIKLFIIIGFLTALTSAITALFIYDIKKIIAYSTCSQLGYMLIACGFGDFSIGYFHLINHAFFKALLFLTAGILIHSCYNEQDIRALGVGYTMPILTIIFSVSSLALIGLPFFSGFYSKEHLLLISLLELNNNSLIIILIGLPTVFTTLYSLRVFHYLFNRNISNKATYKQPLLINYVLIILFVISVVAGFLANELISSPLSNFLLWELKPLTNVISPFDVPSLQDTNTIIINNKSCNLSDKATIQLSYINNGRKDMVSGDCTDRDFLLNGRTGSSNESYVSSSTINKYFGYNPHKFSFIDVNSDMYVREYTHSYSTFLNYYHINFVFYCNKIIHAYFPIKNLFYSAGGNIGDTIIKEDWGVVFFSLINELAPPVFNYENNRFTNFHLLTTLFYHIKFNINFFSDIGEQEFFLFLLAPFFNKNTGYGDAIFYYKGLKAGFENYAYIKGSTANIHIPTYIYYSFLWKLGVITGGYHTGTPLWVVWLIKIHVLKINSPLVPIQKVDILNINFINSTIYSFYYLYILFNNQLVKEINNTVHLVDFWSNMIGSNYYKNAAVTINSWFESSKTRARYSLILPVGAINQLGHIYRIGWNLQSPFLIIYIQNLFNNSVVIEKETSWDYGFLNGLPNMFNYFLLKLSLHKDTSDILKYFNSDINLRLYETLNKNSYSFYKYCNEQNSSVVGNDTVRYISAVPGSAEHISPFELVSIVIFEFNNKYDYREKNSIEYNIVVEWIIESCIPLRWRILGNTSIEKHYNVALDIFNPVELFSFWGVNYILYSILIIIQSYKIFLQFYLNNNCKQIKGTAVDQIKNLYNLISTNLKIIVVIVISKNFLLDNAYNYFIHNALVLIKNFYKYIDKGVFELFGPRGIESLATKYSNITQNLFSEKLPVKTHLKILAYNVLIILIAMSVVFLFL